MKFINIKIIIITITLLIGTSSLLKAQEFSSNNNPTLMDPFPLKTGDWKETVAFTTMNDQLYTIEKDGLLYRTNLTTGEKKSLGSEKFYYTDFLFSHNGMLYTIESDGGVFEIKLIKDGAYEIRTVNGGGNDWKNTEALIVWNRRIYFIKEKVLHRSLTLQRTPIKLGKESKYDTKYMFSVGRLIYIISNEGNLFEINPTNGIKTKLGEDGILKKTTALTTLKNKLYTIQDGTLHRTDTKKGRSSKLTWLSGSWKPKFMFSAGDSLYSIETDGDLFKIDPRNGNYKQIFKKR